MLLGIGFVAWRKVFALIDSPAVAVLSFAKIISASKLKGRQAASAFCSLLSTELLTIVDAILINLSGINAFSSKIRAWGGLSHKNWPVSIFSFSIVCLRLSGSSGWKLVILSISSRRVGGLESIVKNF